VTICRESVTPQSIADYEEKTPSRAEREEEREEREELERREEREEEEGEREGSGRGRERVALGHLDEVTRQETLPLLFDLPWSHPMSMCPINLTSLTRQAEC
jgi:hypothetical protein